MEMIQRSECLYNEEVIGIESIYTVIDGKQINIPDKVESLRKKGRDGLLSCPCGYGTKLILVASDKGVRRQHFRAVNGSSWSECTLKEEGHNSVDSKVVIKCWLADKMDQDIQTRVSINRITNTDRKYEVSHYVPNRNFAVNYTNMRINLEDEKLEALDSIFGKDIIHIVDIDNLETFGQYPEFMIKIQSHQKYCLFLRIEGRDYDKAELNASFYMKDIDGLYQRIEMCAGPLKDYSFSEGNSLMFSNRKLSEIYTEKRTEFIQEQEKEKKRRVEEAKKLQEEQERLVAERKKREAQWRAAEVERHARIAEELRLHRLRLEEEAEKERQRKEEEAERLRQAELEKQKILDGLQEKVEKEIDSYIDEQYIDPFGQKWFKCEACGKVARENAFAIYGGVHKAARGTCHDCLKNRSNNIDFEFKPKKIEIDGNFCPWCGSELVKRNGRYGQFWGCSAYPECSFTKKI